MKTDFVGILLYLYFGCLWLIPIVFIIRSKHNDVRFVVRKLLFPLQYLLQVTFEKVTGNSRAATRFMHIIVFFFSETFLLGAFAILGVFNEPFSNHTPMLLFIAYYFPISAISFWFQPHASKSYLTK
ncbi:MAG: hypothetical protein L0L22_16535 [Staphylococcus equorum]|nr:hypothetical protein [Staphylococcus equorum]MDN6672410.1 hypothetical protein [Staphylococcus equorum]